MAECEYGVFDMDWIERVLHMDPDGGSGATEVVAVAVLASGLVLAGRALYTRLARREHAAPRGEEDMA